MSSGVRIARAGSTSCNHGPFAWRGQHRSRVISTRPSFQSGSFVGGEKAASGVGTGKVVLAHSAADLKNIPKDSVLVAHTTAPRWAQAMDRLNAVVTDLGSVAGHFASVAREWRVPTLVNTGVATQRLKPGEIVTVDADRATVFAGTIQGLSNSLCEKQELSPESPFMKRLRLILDHASPLNS